MSGYVKMFQSMLHSTIWKEPDHVRLVWITMLLLADRDGLVEASIPGLADAAKVNLEQCQDALRRLSGPDEYSRTPDNQGRRVEAVDGGWEILNWEAYRERKSEAHEREQAAKRMQRWRARKKAEQQRKQGKNAHGQDGDVTGGYGVTRNVTPGYPIADPDPDPKEDPDQEEDTAQLTLTAPEAKAKAGTSDFDRFWEAYPKTRRVKKKVARAAFDRARRSKDWPGIDAVIEALDRAKRSADWTEKNGAYIPHPSSWLNQGRWDDEISEGPRTTDDGRERVPVPVPAGLGVPAGLTVRQAIDAAAEAGEDPGLVRRWNYEYTAAVTAIREKGQVPDE